MTLLDPPAESQGKSSALKFTLIAVILAIIIGGWFLFRYYPEKRAVNHFFDALLAGDTARAYQDWKPSKSYKIVRAEAPKKSNGVIVSVAVSPFSPMPEANDAEKSRRTKVIPIWVDTESKAMSFSPVTPEE